jgi:hypothetical protein
VGRGEYLRAGAWLGDLRRLHEAGWSDAAVAAALSECLGRRVSRRMVLYWRLADVPPCERNPPRVRRRVYQMVTGWCHLLPRGLRWPLKGYSSGVLLSPRECDVLSALRDHGPLTPAQLAGLFGRGGLRSRRRSRLTRLVDQGLVVRLAPRLFALAPRALPRPARRPLTGNERRECR